MKLSLKCGKSLCPPKKIRPTDTVEFWQQPARLLDIIKSTPDRPARPNWPNGVIGEIGLIVAPGLRTRYEGPTERYAIICEWAARRPGEVIAQPETAIIGIGGRKLKHFPDFLLVDGSGERRLEAKSRTAMDDPVQLERFRTIARCYADAGLSYELATADAVRNGGFAKAVGWVFRNHGRPIPKQREKRILEVLEDMRPVPGKEIATRLGETFSDHLRRDLCSLHARGLCAIDLFGGVPSPETRVVKGPASITPPWLSAGEF